MGFEFERGRDWILGRGTRGQGSGAGHGVLNASVSHEGWGKIAWLDAVLSELFDHDLFYTELIGILCWDLSKRGKGRLTRRIYFHMAI